MVSFSEKCSLAIAQHVLRIRSEHADRLKFAKKLSADYQCCHLNSLVPLSYHKVTDETLQKLEINPVERLRSLNQSIEVSTVLNGVTETINVARIGDFIICGASREMYVLRPGTVVENYEFDDSTNTLTTKSPKRIVFQFLERDYDEVAEKIGVEGDLEFQSPWGSPMRLEVNDYIVFEQTAAAVLNDANPSPDQLIRRFFRVELKAFRATYSIIE